MAGVVAIAALGLASCTWNGAEVSPAPTSAARPDAPEARYFVSRSDFSISYLLEGKTLDSHMVALTSGASYYLETEVRSDTKMVAGARIGTTRVVPEVLASLAERSESSRIDAGEYQRLLDAETPVFAPVAGTFQVDEEGAWIESDGIDIVVDLSPIQMLRYESLDLSGTATVETVVGTRQVACAALSATQRSSEHLAAESAEQGAQLNCRLPLGIETTSGLRAQLALTSPPLKDVIVVPYDYLTYDNATDGYVVWSRKDGELVPIEVELGPSDGVRRVVRTALPIGLELVRRTDTQQ